MIYWQWVWNLIVLPIFLSKPRNLSRTIKSAFQIPHHVAIRISVYAPPRRTLSRNIGAGGDDIPHSAEKGWSMRWNVATICVEVEVRPRFAWANSVKVCSPAIVILDKKIIISSRIWSCILPPKWGGNNVEEYKIAMFKKEDRETGTIKRLLYVIHL